jgi:choline kinase
VREYNSPSVAVVLAAGAGTRIGAAQSRIPKPLTNLRRVPLLNRALRSVQSAGIERAVVVVGYRAELVQTQAREAAASLGLQITVVTNPHWMTGNGSSLLAAAPHVTSRCIVVMADHLTPPSFLRLLVDSNEDTAGLLVVDPESDTVYDLDDATKVRLTGSRIVAIGKQLKHFDAIDTGAFLFDRRIFQALRTASAAGHDELSAAVQHLANDGLMHSVLSDGSFWCDIDTPEDLAFASRALEHELRRDSPASPEQAAIAGK